VAGSSRLGRWALTPWRVRAEVEQVVTDLVYWRRPGVTVLAVEPLPGSGARIGVHDLGPLVTRPVRARYGFPDECWEAPMPGAGPASPRPAGPIG
jgi:hypothetical protein